MAADRRFLGWDKPLLAQAAACLLERYLGGGPVDGPLDLGPGFDRVMVVVPGARAGRRLGELLADQPASRHLVPPSIVTVGQLPERLYESQLVTTAPM